MHRGNFKFFKVQLEKALFHFIDTQSMKIHLKNPTLSIKNQPSFKQYQDFQVKVS